MDKYDRAIEWLTQNPDEIERAWGQPEFTPVGCCLFQYANSSGYIRSSVNGVCGCLTEVRRGNWSAETAELTNAIRADIRLPRSGATITVEHLPVFAEWQRRLDVELNRDQGEE
jgi:hypothetical protein